MQANFKETVMNLYYTKTLLYAYPHIQAVMDQIDDLVLRKALSSMNDFSPCEEQCAKILALTGQKTVLIELKEKLDAVMNKLSAYELDCLEYKYFKQKNTEYFLGFDAVSRKYFRRQIALAEKLCKLIEKTGINNQWFKDKCLTISFFSELYIRVLQKEKETKKTKKPVTVVEETRLSA